jgi:hypothetical protein
MTVALLMQRKGSEAVEKKGLWLVMQFFPEIFKMGLRIELMS